MYLRYGFCAVCRGGWRGRLRPPDHKALPAHTKRSMVQQCTMRLLVSPVKAWHKAGLKISVDGPKHWRTPVRLVEHDPVKNNLYTPKKGNRS